MDQLANSDYRLLEKIGEYEEAYFEDFLLSPDSILHDFLCYEVEIEPGKRIETSDDQPPMELYENYYFKVDDLDEGGGMCDPKAHTITIDPESIDDPAVILHEMIHAYIDLLENKNFLMMDCLLLKLYTNLAAKIPDLEERIIGHSHRIKQEDFDNHGWHGLLFFLKSLDLDLRLGLALGTVCGYGRDTETSP